MECVSRTALVKQERSQKHTARRGAQASAAQGSVGPGCPCPQDIGSEVLLACNLLPSTLPITPSLLA